MKKVPKQNQKTQRGAVSFYAVIFTALIMSVVTLSFVRLMLSEQTQTSGDDQSDSAYDAALAGVEDAKTLLKQCLAAGNCDQYYADLSSDTACETTQNLANSYNNGGVVDEAGDEYYTCVLMSNVTEDYRVTIAGSSQKVAMVPLKHSGTVNAVEIQWSSNKSNNLGGSLLPTYGNMTSPDIVTVQFIDGYTPSSYWVDGSGGNGTRSSALVLRPSSSGDSSISSDVVNSSAVYTNVKTVRKVKCEQRSAKTTCTISISLPPAYAGSEDLMLIGVPYGGDSDFSITLKNGNSTVNFEGAQIAVDATGRTNDRYRRVESRITLSNVAIYPEFTLSLSGDGSGGQLKKNYYVTKNCWKSSGGTASDCPNSGTL